MIDAIVAGRLHGKPTSRNTKAGKPFTVAKVRISVADGESLFASVLAFDQATATALLALGDGDSVALSGSLTPKVWTDRDGNAKPALDLVAHAVLTAYHVTKKRQAMKPGGSVAPPKQAGIDGFDDDVNF